MQTVHEKNHDPNKPGPELQTYADNKTFFDGLETVLLVIVIILGIALIIANIGRLDGFWRAIS